MIKHLKNNLFLQFTIGSFVVLAAVAVFITYMLSGADTHFRVVQAVGAGFILLYILLAGIVWKGWRIIIRQRKGRKEAENLFKTLSGSSLIGIYVIVDGKFRLVNPQFEKITGYCESDLVGKEPLSIVFPEDQKQVRESALRMLKGQSCEPYEYRALNKNGDVRWIMETVASINYDGKRATLGNYMDITGLKLTRKTLEDTREKFRHAQKMEAIGRLAGGIAHDFNNLLTVITVCGDTLLEKVGNDESMCRDVEDIRKASDRAASLTNKLLLLSRKHIQHSEVLDLNIVTSEIAKMLQRILGEDCQLEIILEDELKSINADRGLIEQAMMNLVVNARDALPNGGKITIKTERVMLGEKDVVFMANARAGEFVRLSVTDNGVGMSEEVKQHLFEPFFTTKERGKGTGLGLSTVYGIVKQLGGWINVYSEVGKGSRFAIYLPAYQPAAGDQALSGKKEVRKDFCGNGERILLVEDEEQILNLSGRLLTESGYVVFPAKSVNEAMSVFLGQGGSFHLVFSDVVLPDGSGFELVKLLEKLNPDIRIVISSGYADEISQFSQIKDRGYPYLQKPYKVDTLLQNIRETLSKDKSEVMA